jgi:simple sugar transport system ATP-binding protein
MRDIVKTFPGGVTANDHIDFSVRRGEIHGLLGENGAGKSTLMKILYGLYRPDSGEMYFNGGRLNPDSPQEAIDAGIGMVHQHFMLVPRLAVIQNVILGEREAPEWVTTTLRDSGWLGSLLRGLTMETGLPREKLKDLSEEYGIEVELDKRVWELDVGEQQRVEILKALYRDIDLLILDEPTAVLTPLESERLFETLRKVTDQGVSIIFITHKLEEITSNTDRVTVLRDGQLIDTVATSTVTEADLAEMMVGREVLFSTEGRAHRVGESVLETSALCAEDDRRVQALDEIDLELREGEIVGVAGVSGNGQLELAQCLAGVRTPTSGSIRVHDEEFAGKSSREFVDAGVSYIPADRLEHGCSPNRSVRENLIIKNVGSFREGLFIDTEATREYAERLVEEYDIRVSSIDVEASKLSGGNLQKLIVARELDHDPDVLIANQPTRGVDVGAIEYIREVILKQREEGTAVLLISESLEELVELSDRLVVMYDGNIVHETPAETADRRRISQYMNQGTTTDGVGTDPDRDSPDTPVEEVS